MGVRARITVGGRLFLSTDQHHPVLTAGHGTEVALLMRRAATRTAGEVGEAAGATGTPPATRGGATATVENTYWKLTRVGEVPVAVAGGQREAHLILNGATGRG